MKKTLLTITFILGIIIAQIVFASWSSGDFHQKNTSGSPAGYSGSPADNICTACHTGPAATAQTGWITSNVPVAGYTPGVTYAITATAARVGHTKFGFEISPQNNAGGQQGTLISTSTETQMVTGKYITHSAMGTNGPSGSKTWTFNWTAPAAGTGAVHFYGAFNITNAGNNASGDTIYTSTLVINENSGIGIAGNYAGISGISVYPNPVCGFLNMEYSLSLTSLVDIRLFDVQGKFIANLYSDVRTPGDYQSRFTMNQYLIPKGIYLLQITTGENISVRKIFTE